MQAWILAGALTLTVLALVQELNAAAEILSAGYGDLVRVARGEVRLRLCAYRAAAWANIESGLEQWAAERHAAGLGTISTVRERLADQYRNCQGQEPPGLGMGGDSPEEVTCADPDLRDWVIVLHREHSRTYPSWPNLRPMWRPH